MNIQLCTIASANYLPRVRVLQQSLQKFHPELRLHVLLCEKPQEIPKLSLEANYEFISPEQVCSDWPSLAFRYDITEFNTALKPFLLEYLLSNHCDAIIYLDPDIEIFSSLQPLLDLFDSHDLILTPHVCRPMDVDGKRPGIDSIIRAGIYNLGFIGLADGPESRAALLWWQKVCHEYCYFDATHLYFVDQFWAAALPAFIQRFHSLRDPGYNLAYWNIFQRELKKVGSQWLVDDVDLRFFHFSGLPVELHLVSKHQDRVVAKIGSDLHEMLAGYKDRVSQNDWSRFGSFLYSLSEYTDGSAITRTERRAFGEMSEEKKAHLPDPFLHPKELHAAGVRFARRAIPAKYFRLLALEGIIKGHHILFFHFFNIFKQRLTGTKGRR